MAAGGPSGPSTPQYAGSVYPVGSYFEYDPFDFIDELDATL